MDSKNIFDTIECRKTIIAYLDYLDKGNEVAETQFLVDIMNKLFTDKSFPMMARKTEMMSQGQHAKHKVATVNNTENLAELASVLQKEKDKFTMLAVKKCLETEVKMNYTRVDAIINNPSFAKEIASGNLLIKIL